MSLAKYHGEDINLSFEDLAASPSTAQAIEGMTLDLENVFIDASQPVNVAAQFRLNEKGRKRQRDGHAQSLNAQLAVLKSEVSRRLISCG